DTKDPDGVPIQRLMIAQDVGAAITGPVRGDIFWGHGEEAFLKAGRMKSAGSYYVFVPKPPTPAAPEAEVQPSAPANTP
ncbi:MAG: murein transglycosylase, partial [Rhodospirillaceae bacterium]|nr:murein transglycosylase [Rhodospirillaceae bacterium]